MSKKIRPEEVSCSSYKMKHFFDMRLKAKRQKRNEKRSIIYERHNILRRESLRGKNRAVF